MWFYYPNWAKTIWDTWVQIQWPFETIEDCNNRVKNTHKKSGAKTYDFQCWYKCKYIPEVDFYQCKEFRKF